MPALRCSICGIKYPYHPEFKRCKGCGEATSPLRNADADDDWKEEAAQVRIRLAGETSIRDDSGVVCIECDVAEREGYFFVDSREVIRAGYAPKLLPDSVIRISETLYEVVGYIDSTREYWVIPKEEESAPGRREKATATA